MIGIFSSYIFVTVTAGNVVSNVASLFPRRQPCIYCPVFPLSFLPFFSWFKLGSRSRFGSTGFVLICVPNKGHGHLTGKSLGWRLLLYWIWMCGIQAERSILPIFFSLTLSGGFRHPWMSLELSICRLFLLRRAWRHTSGKRMLARESGRDSPMSPVLSLATFDFFSSQPLRRKEQFCRKLPIFADWC